MIENKKELIDFIDKVGYPRIEPCSTVIKGGVVFYGHVPTICTPSVMCNFSDEKEVRSIIDNYIESSDND